MANYTAYKTINIDYIWHFPENGYPLESGYGLNYGRFYGQFVELSEDLWSTAPFFLIAGYGLNYGRFYERSWLPPITPDYPIGGYGLNYGRFYGFYLEIPRNIIIWETSYVADEAAHTDNLPVAYSSVNHSACKAPTLTDVFYGRLLVEPANIDFGIVVSTQTQNVVAWNGYLDQTITLDDLLLSGFDGLSVIGDTPPSIFLPLQERIYEIHVTMDGPPNIDARIRFDWETGFDDNYVYIIGRRIVLFPYLYKTNMMETLEWMTNILTNDDGSEQRQSIREYPRQRFSIKSFIQTSEHARADNILYGWRHQTWAVPVWSEGRHPTSAVTALDTTIQVDTRFGDFRADDLALIWENERKSDLFVVLSFTDTQITLDRGINDDFGVDAIVAPVRVGRMTSHPQRRSKGHNAILSVVFEVEDNIGFAVGASAVVYLTEDTYLDVPDKPGGKVFKDNYIRDIRVVDYKTGIVTFYSPWEHTKVSRDFLVVLEGLEDIWNFRLWLHRRAGKQRPFWMPTFERNMLVTGTGNIGLTMIIREDANRSQGSDRDHIFIKMKDGTEYLRAVLSIEDVGGLGLENTVTIDSSISENQEDVDFISYMGFKRLNSDRIKLKWLADNKVECTVPIKEIEP